MKKISVFLYIGILLLTACSFNDGGQENETEIPTATFASLALTPPQTATMSSTRTPLPTFTSTPSITPIPPTATDTPIPTATPPVMGIVNGRQAINVREGPSTNFEIIRALIPGTPIEIIYQNPEGTWYNIVMDDGVQGWMIATAIYLQETPTPIPSMTPSPDLTALAMGTSLPTALIGGGTMTPTPPRSAVTATPIGTPAATDIADGTDEPTVSFLPVINIDTINMTATSLAAGILNVSPPAEITIEPLTTATPMATSTGDVVPANTSGPIPTLAPDAVTSPIPTSSGDANVKIGADIFAMCNDLNYGVPAPTDLAAGSTAEVYWAWFATSTEYIQQHVDAVTYEVRINDVLLSNWRQYGFPVGSVSSGWYVKYWYVPVGELESGEYHISYRATWSEQVTDGNAYFGPGTANLIDEGTCDFVVR
jgi:hypothetical protein